ncbi:alpha/beta hydrolase fold domain-containing protein [Quadrisphaera sp. INWT6]|uniref:alpha/beta hydrolase fold domain-containing protein n=1 Tax=Quadrisphaera sp. INWT6 TaxID=2596917 RepID=UPI001892514E|nr:alpha/beta hydrolase fold domain-containing protein [Quadrisphaera sp. INWT6]
MLQLHGGGFINRYPEQDLHIARYLAASLGATVVLPDYDTAPTARYPVAEEEVYDIACWVQAHGRTQGWDGERLLLSGVSAGAKLSINTCQQLHAAGAPLPVAVSLIVPFTDATRADRTSAAARPAISPMVQRAVQWSYFPDVVRRAEVLASPRLDAALPAAMPPTLIQSGEMDTLAADAEELAEVLHTAGVEVVHRQYPGADHDFYSKEPVATVRALLAEIERFFSSHLTPTR